MTAPTSTAVGTPYVSSHVGPAAEFEALRQVVAHYTEGLRTGSVERLREAFHAEATMCGQLGSEPMVTPIQGLYDFVTAHPAPVVSGEPTEFATTSLQVSRDTATAEVMERAYMGHDFRTSFQMLKIDGRWWITAKLFDGVPRS